MAVTLRRLPGRVVLALVGLAACSAESEESNRRTGDSRGVRSEPLTLDASIPYLDFYVDAPGGKSIALTFDDGPDETYTGRVLDVLRAANVRATFFVNTNNYIDVNASSIGRHMLERMHAEGHHVGNHTVDHDDLGSATTDVTSELSGVQELLRSIIPGALQQRLFRAPYGNPYFGPQERLAVVAPIVARYGVHAGWNIDSLDWKCTTNACVLGNVLREVDAGRTGIVLLHSTSPRTAGALSSLISSLKTRGKQFVFVEDLVVAKYGKPSRQLITCGSNADCVEGETCQSDRHCLPSSGSGGGADGGAAGDGAVGADSGVSADGGAAADSETPADGSAATDSAATDGSATADSGVGVDGGSSLLVTCSAFVVTSGVVSGSAEACGGAGALATRNGVNVRYLPSSGSTKTSAYAQYELAGSPKSLAVEVSFLGDDRTEPLWYWSLRDATTGVWVQLGDNSWAGNWVTTEHSFTVSTPSRYVDTSGHVKVRFKTTSSTNDAELDRMVLRVTY